MTTIETTMRSEDTDEQRPSPRKSRNPLSRKHPRRQAPAPAGDASGSPGEVRPWDLPGSPLRTNERRAAAGFYAPALTGSPSTTKQAQILRTALIGRPTGTKGVVIGRDRLSDTAIAHDPFTAYNLTPRLVSSTNVINMGDVGSGKSSNTKCNYVARPLMLARRRAVVFDKKDQEGQGEYAPLCNEFNVEPLRFSEDGTGTRVNLLDPAIVRAGGLRGQKRLLTTIARLAAEDESVIGKWEMRAIGAALQRAQLEHQRRVPVLSDVLTVLPRVPDLDEFRFLSLAAKERLHQAAVTVLFTLQDLMEDYSGLLDGETSKNVSLTGKLTSFDISQLPDEGPAVPVVMAIGHMWLLGMLRGDTGWLTNCVYEEGWHIIGGPTAKLARSTQKLSRGLGLSNIINIHKGSDIPADSPGMAMIQEAQTVHVYRQTRPADAEWAQETFGFDPSTVQTITELGNGVSLLKIASHPETMIEHVRTPWEMRITDTDGALKTPAAA